MSAKQLELCGVGCPLADLSECETVQVRTSEGANEKTRAKMTIFNEMVLFQEFVHVKIPSLSSNLRYLPPPIHNLLTEWGNRHVGVINLMQ